MKEGVERNIVTQAEREATMRTLGHSASTVNRYYIPDDRYKLTLILYIAILITLLPHDRLADARKATAAYDRFFQSGQEEEEMEQHSMGLESDSDFEETNIEIDDEKGENEDVEKEEEEDEAQQQHVMGMESEDEEVKEYEWAEEAEVEAEAQQVQQQVWGKYHPDTRTAIDGANIRVPWSEAERGYVRKWIIDNPDVPVRLLYEDVQACNVARDIFHAHHVELDKISYMFKLLRKTVL